MPQGHSGFLFFFHFLLGVPFRAAISPEIRLIYDESIATNPREKITACREETAVSGIFAFGVTRRAVFRLECTAKKKFKLTR